MNSNKKPRTVRVVPPPFNRQAGPARQFKPVVAQLKTPVMNAPNVRPHVAPPAYRPQPTPKVLQTKSSLIPSPLTGQARRQPVVGPVYRPEVKMIVQPKGISRQKLATSPIVKSQEQRRARQPTIPTAVQSHTSAVYRPLPKPANAKSHLPVQMKSKPVSPRTMKGRPSGGVVQRDVVDDKRTLLLDRFNRPEERAQVIADYYYKQLWLHDRLRNMSYDFVFNRVMEILPAINHLIDDPSVKIPVEVFGRVINRNLRHALWLRSKGGTKLMSHRDMVDEKRSAALFEHFNFFDQHMIWRFTSLPHTECLYIARDASHEEIAEVVARHSGGNDKRNPKVKTLSFGRNLGALIGVAASTGGDKHVLNIADKAEYLYGIDIRTLAAKGISAHPATSRFISLFETEYVLLCTPGDTHTLDSIATVRYRNPFKDQAIRVMMAKGEEKREDVLKKDRGMESIVAEMEKKRKPPERVLGVLLMPDPEAKVVIDYALVAKMAATYQSAAVRTKEGFDLKTMAKPAMEKYLAKLPKKPKKPPDQDDES
ncbi:MAG TPA: hypothetical protein VM656_12320 [Pyrinomonadaceae bacterium]|nr:hypothetical protein [Pyrinomonadaceae bacterium]